MLRVDPKLTLTLHLIKPLDRHGYLDLGPALGEGSTNRTQTKLYQPGREESVELPSVIAGIYFAEYYEFKDAYFSSSLYIDKPGTGWWLHPDGKVEEIIIPAGSWQLGINQTYPTNEGLFMVSSLHKTGRDPGMAGGYVLRGQKFVKIIF